MVETAYDWIAKATWIFWGGEDWGIEGRWGNGCFWGLTSVCALCFSCCCYVAIEASSKAPLFIEHMILWRGEPANHFSKFLVSFWFSWPYNLAIFFLWSIKIWPHLWWLWNAPDRQTDRHASFPSAYLCLLHFWVNTSVVKIDALCLANLYLSLNFRSFGSFGFRTVWNSGRRMARFLEIFGFKAVRVSGGIVTRDLG